MKHGKYETRTPRRANRGKPAYLALCIVLLLFLSVGGTLAYVMVSSGLMRNQFEPVQVSSQVVFSGNTVSVRNTSDVTAYLRAIPAVNWMDGSGNVSAARPTQTVTPTSDWVEVDGIYYYQYPVPSGSAVTFIESLPTGSNGEYELTVEVVAEAIQAEGMGSDIDTAQKAWAAALTRPGNG